MKYLRWILLVSIHYLTTWVPPYVIHYSTSGPHSEEWLLCDTKLRRTLFPGLHDSEKGDIEELADRLTRGFNSGQDYKRPARPCKKCLNHPNYEMLLLANIDL